jgi:tetraacyldisaccharide 4'-kinase
MKAPFLDRIWYPDRRPGPAERLAASLLNPLSWLYRAGAALAHPAAQPCRVDRPVISVGNLTVGGNGKTPLVIELARSLQAQGRRVAVVSRGYRRRTRGTQVAYLPGDPLPRSEPYGDEPALLARRCPAAAVVVGEDRVAAARLAIRQFNPDAILCDDAFQHRGLHRDLDILAVHARRGFGNRRLLPRGPLREPIAYARRASLVVFTHGDPQDAEELRRRHGLPEDLPAVGCALVPAGFCSQERWEVSEAPPVSGPCLAVSALANPHGLLSSCREAGLPLAGQLCFRDHAEFGRGAITAIEREIKRTGAAGLVTSEKDLVRLPPGLSLPVFALRLRVQWWRDDLHRVEGLLARVVPGGMAP